MLLVSGKTISIYHSVLEMLTIHHNRISFKPIASLVKGLYEQSAIIGYLYHYYACAYACD